jgi:nucleoside-diphosphate-sugar epimerase
LRRSGTANPATMAAPAAPRTNRRRAPTRAKARRVYGRLRLTESEIELDGRRVAVTGAGGFIGAAVSRRLVAEGCHVTGVDRDEAGGVRARASGAEFVRADVADREAIGGAIEGAELVVHTAALVTDYGEMDEFVRVNVGGTRNILDAAEAGGAERVLHLSSVVVYGLDTSEELDETAFRRSSGVPYIDTKSASDRLACRRGAVVIRPGDVYGPGSVPWTIRPARMASTGQLALPRGDPLMLAVYIDDLVEGIVLGLRRGHPGRAYTIWSGERLTIAELFDRYAQMAGMRRARRLPVSVLRSAGVAYEAIARVRGEPPPFSRNAVTLLNRRGTVSNRRATEELGWAPQVDFEEGMKRTEEWLRSEGLV